MSLHLSHLVRIFLMKYMLGNAWFMPVSEINNNLSYLLYIGGGHS